MASDKTSVAALMKNILQRGNPFTSEKSQIRNIATGATLEKEEEDFLVECINLSRAARNEFYQSHLEEKALQLFDTIPKTKRKTKKKISQIKYDIAKETVKFLRHIDYARLRGFDIGPLMASEIKPL